MANPSGLLHGAILMLNHIGQSDVTEKIQNSRLKTPEDGIHIYDMYKEGHSQQKAGTKEFVQTVIERLGKQPQQVNPVRYATGVDIQLKPYLRTQTHSCQRSRRYGRICALDRTAVKINYHQNRIQQQQNEEDIKMSGNRIKSIERELKLAPAYCSDFKTIDLMTTLSILNLPIAATANP